LGGSGKAKFEYETIPEKRKIGKWVVVLKAQYLGGDGKD
jgi:hypothetical protein